MGTQPSKHPDTIFLPHCWICGCKFIDTGGTQMREEHHMVPRAYGGVDGPTVTLCDTHHTKMHRVAECLIHENTHRSILEGEPPEAIKKILYLASVICNAWKFSLNDPNKSASVMVSLDRRHRLMIEALKRIYPKAKSRAAVLNLALEHLYSRHFPPSPPTK